MFVWVIIRYINAFFKHCYLNVYILTKILFLFFCLQPIFLNIRLKVFKGTIRSSCEHVKNHQLNDASSLNPITHTVKCLLSNAAFYSLLLECLKFNSRLSQNAIAPIVDVNCVNRKIDTLPIAPQPPSSNQYKPIINVTDTENENICMCDLYANSGDNDVLDSMNLDRTVCTKCHNILQSSSTVQHRTMITKSLTMGNDIIVNRVDAHYLNLNMWKNPEPYTPESVESHSPAPADLDDEYQRQSNLEINQNIIEPKGNKNTLSISGTKAVSPRQLKSRLENLQRPLDETYIQDKKGCFERFCEIL